LQGAEEEAEAEYKAAKQRIETRAQAAWKAEKVPPKSVQTRSRELICHLVCKGEAVVARAVRVR
jgi:hypothetical protein